MGGAAAAAAGEMGRHPQRMLRLRLSGPRPPDPRRARARRGRTFPCASRRHRRQPRRLCLDLRRRHPERDLQRAAGRRVPHAGDRRAIDRRVHQHRADRRLSRRRPAGSLLCAGAARRRGGARARDRPRRDPAAQSRAGRGHALQDADRSDLRLRKFPEVFSRAARSCRLRRLCQTPAREPHARGSPAASASPAMSKSSGVAPSRLPAALGARVGFFEAASIRVQPDGSVQALLGTHNHGQGHATTFAQIIASRLGVPMATSRSSKATPTRCRTAPARSARARSRSAARRSTAPR